MCATCRDGKRRLCGIKLHQGIGARDNTEENSMIFTTKRVAEEQNSTNKLLKSVQIKQNIPH